MFELSIGIAFGALVMVCFIADMINTEWTGGENGIPLRGQEITPAVDAWLKANEVEYGDWLYGAMITNGVWMVFSRRQGKWIPEDK